MYGKFEIKQLYASLLLTDKRYLSSDGTTDILLRHAKSTAPMVTAKEIYPKVVLTISTLRQLQKLDFKVGAFSDAEEEVYKLPSLQKDYFMTLIPTMKDKKYMSSRFLHNGKSATLSVERLDYNVLKIVLRCPDIRVAGPVAFIIIEDDMFTNNKPETQAAVQKWLDLLCSKGVDKHQPLHERFGLVTPQDVFYTVYDYVRMHECVVYQDIIHLSPKYKLVAYQNTIHIELFNSCESRDVTTGERVYASDELFALFNSILHTIKQSGSCEHCTAKHKAMCKKLLDYFTLDPNVYQADSGKYTFPGGLYQMVEYDWNSQSFALQYNADSGNVVPFIIPNTDNRLFITGDKHVDVFEDFDEFFSDDMIPTVLDEVHNLTAIIAGLSHKDCKHVLNTMFKACRRVLPEADFDKLLSDISGVINALKEEGAESE